MEQYVYIPESIMDTGSKPMSPPTFFVRAYQEFHYVTINRLRAMEEIGKAIGKQGQRAVTCMTEKDRCFPNSDKTITTRFQIHNWTSFLFPHVFEL
jgi:hypothetical protein